MSGGPDALIGKRWLDADGGVGERQAQPLGQTALQVVGLLLS